MKRKGVGMITKQKDLGEQMRGLEAVWGGGRKERVSCPISDSGDLYMSPEYVVLPDMSDSDGHCGPGIQRFPLLPIPPARPLHPRDKMRRRRVS